MNQQENYFSVIPSRILSDNKLTPMARLMYGKLASLTNVEGYCWASNSYLGEFFTINERSASRCVCALEKAKYIRVEISDNSKRRIYLVDNLRPTLDKNVQGVRQNCLGGTTKLSNNYNKRSNKTNNNGECSKEHNSEASRAELEALKRHSPIKSL